MKKIVVLFITFGLIFGLMACDDSVVDPIVNPPDITDPEDPVDPVDTNENKPAVITEKTDVLKVFTASSAAPDFRTYVTITD
jgi:hypothetical protein